MEIRVERRRASPAVAHRGRVWEGNGWGPPPYPSHLSCGEGGIRTLDTAFGPYNGLANRRLRPLGHLSKVAPTIVDHGGRRKGAGQRSGNQGSSPGGMRPPVQPSTGA